MIDLKLKTLLGFEKGKTPCQQGRIEKQLKKRLTYNGREVDITKADQIVYSIFKENYKPYKEENCWHYKRDGEKSKPKTEYEINTKTENGTYFISLNKTQYDFAVYVYENFKTLNDVLEKDKECFAVVEKLEQERLDQERLEEEKLERRRKIKKTFEKWMIAEVNNLPQQQVDIITKVFTDRFGSCWVKAYTLAVCVNHFDNALCKQNVIELLHNENKASIKCFELLTGLRLPKSYGERIEYLKNISSKDFVKKAS